MGLAENIRNIFFITFFSFFSISHSLKKFNKFIFFHNNLWKKYDSYKDFIDDFLNNLLSKNLDFYSHFRPHKNNFFDLIINLINKKILNFYKSKKVILLCGPKKLQKKIIDLCNNNKIFFVIRNNNDFRFYHLILNFINLFLFSKKIFHYSPINYYKKEKNMTKFFENFFAKIKTNEIVHFEKKLHKILSNYCENQISLKKNLTEFLENYHFNFAIVDQLRFDVATILSSIVKEKGIDVILVPHGSLSTPNNQVTKFMYSISGKGLLFSSLASHVVAQTKISYESIKYFDNKLKILKSKKIMFGEKKIYFSTTKSKIQTFLHASTPKSLYKWPWIHETYTEYIFNLKKIINALECHNNVKLIVRYRPSPECDFKKFNEILNLEQHEFVELSKNKNFTDDLSISDYLISFSSTVIEEGLSYNKPVIVYSGSKNYKHINYDFNDQKSIYFLNDKNLEKSINLIVNNDISKINNNINWSDKDLLKDSLFSYLVRQDNFLETQ